MKTRSRIRSNPPTLQSSTSEAGRLERHRSVGLRPATNYEDISDRGCRMGFPAESILAKLGYSARVKNSAPALWQATGHHGNDYSMAPISSLLPKPYLRNLRVATGLQAGPLQSSFEHR